MTLRDVASRLGYTTQLGGKWTGRSAGGNPTNSTYVFNPHYRFAVGMATNQTALHAILTSADRTPVNLKLFRLPNAQMARIQQYVASKRRTRVLAKLQAQVRNCDTRGGFFGRSVLPQYRKLTVREAAARSLCLCSLLLRIWQDCLLFSKSTKHARHRGFSDSARRCRTLCEDVQRRLGSSQRRRQRKRDHFPRQSQISAEGAYGLYATPSPGRRAKQHAHQRRGLFHK